MHTADTIINVVTVTAPGRYAALAVARAVVSDALKLQAPSPIQLGSDAPCRGAAVKGHIARLLVISDTPAVQLRMVGSLRWLPGTIG